MENVISAFITLATFFFITSICPLKLEAATSTESARHHTIHGIITQETNAVIRFASFEQPQCIIYGNSEIGFFETKDFTAQRGELAINLIPPTYRKPIQLFADSNGTRKLLGEKKFESPFPKSYESLGAKILHGNFTSNFYLVSGSLPQSHFNNPHSKTVSIEEAKSLRNRFSLIMILNRFGELIWTYVPMNAGQPLHSYLVTKPLGNGRYGILGGKADGYFAVVHSNGKTVQELSTRTGNQPFVMHHDFLMNRNGGFLTFGTKSTASASATQKAPTTFLSDTIIKVDPVESESNVVYDFLSIFHPLTERHWQEPSTKKRFVLWDSPKADADFIHANTIDLVPGKGFLFSLKHLDRLVMLDSDFKNVHWTLGPTENDTYRTTGDASFSHQHGAHVLANGNVLLFDNGFRKKRSRVIELNLKDKSANLTWSYAPNVSMYSRNRSHAVRLENQNTLALFVAPKVAGKSNVGPESDYLIEVDKSGKREVGRMRIDFATKSAGYRATPLNQVGNEVFLGLLPGNP